MLIHYVLKLIKHPSNNHFFKYLIKNFNIFMNRNERTAKYYTFFLEKTHLSEFSICHNLCSMNNLSVSCVGFFPHFSQCYYIILFFFLVWTSYFITWAANNFQNSIHFLMHIAHWRKLNGFFFIGLKMAYLTLNGSH